MVFFNTREDVYNSLEIDINATVATLKDILNDRFKQQSYNNVKLSDLLSSKSIAN